MLTGGTEPHGKVGLVDGGHHVSARVDEGAGEVVGGWGCIAGPPSALALGVRCD